MGIEYELFVHPDRISSQLICSICTVILENPVQTDNEHLFCEEELLEWLTHSSLCPISHTNLDITAIRKPPRIITNMLNELEVFCRNKRDGCPWQGEYASLATHMKSCNMKSKEHLISELSRKDSRIESLEEELKIAKYRIIELEELNNDLELAAQSFERKLKVYDAFFADDGEGKNNSIAVSGYYTSNDRAIVEESALQRVARLRRLETFQNTTGTVGIGAHK